MIVQLPGIQPEIAVQAIPDDERVWVPQAPGVWFRPLLLNTVTGSWCNLLRVRRAGVLSRHIHPSWVTGYVIRGAWRYLEHDWVAREGDFIFETASSSHTFVTEGDEMVEVFAIVEGALEFQDDDGNPIAIEDWQSMQQRYLDYCSEHGIEPTEVTELSEVPVA
jgi:2,4'-dihydroxyacetophenone dioxygenase